MMIILKNREKIGIIKNFILLLMCLSFVLLQTHWSGAEDQFTKFRSNGNPPDNEIGKNKDLKNALKSPSVKDKEPSVAALKGHKKNEGKDQKKNKKKNKRAAKKAAQKALENENKKANKGKTEKSIATSKKAKPERLIDRLKKDKLKYTNSGPLESYHNKSSLLKRH